VWYEETYLEGLRENCLSAAGARPG
jgi:hypothetical protein